MFHSELLSGLVSQICAHIPVPPPVMTATKPSTENKFEVCVGIMVLQGKILASVHEKSIDLANCSHETSII